MHNPIPQKNRQQAYLEAYRFLPCLLPIAYLQQPAVHAVQHEGQVEPVVQQLAVGQHLAQQSLHDFVAGACGLAAATPTNATAPNYNDRREDITNTPKNNRIAFRPPATLILRISHPTLSYSHFLPDSHDIFPPGR
jgi:hypothetical protein